MAHKRMFSKTITDSDDFLDMPVSARLLYYDLGMNADDDGFIQPGRVMKSTGASKDDLAILVAKKFVISFDNGKVFVIADWRINNTVRKDRYTATIYTQYKKMLYLSEENKWQPNGNQMATIGMHRRGKERREKKRYTITSSSEDSLVLETKETGQIITNPPIPAAPPFDLAEEIEKLKMSKKKNLRLAGYYLHRRELELPTKVAFQRELKRNLAAAKILEGYDTEKILKTMDYCDKKFPLWTLETIIKIIPNA